MKILKYIKINWVLFIATLILIFIEMLGSLLIPTISGNIINHGVLNSDMDYIIKYGIIMFLVALVAALVSLVNGYLAALISSKLSMDLRNAIYEKSQKLSVVDFNRFTTASMITRSSNDVNQIQQAFMMFTQIVLPIPIIAFISIYLSFSRNTSLRFVLTAFAIITLIVAFFLVRKTIPIFARLQGLLDKINAKFRSFLVGVRVIRAFNHEKDEEKRVNDSFLDYNTTAIKANRLFALMNSSTFLIINLAIVAIMFVGGIQISFGSILVGNVVAVSEYAIMFLSFLIMGQMVMVILPRAKISLERIVEVLEANESIVDPIVSTKDDKNTENIMKVVNATFRYDDSENDVLHDLNFSIKIGETTAIIGGTGSGKSTIASLMLRLHDVQEGAILVNGVNIKEMTQHELRNIISYVPQKAFLFSGSILDNLRFGNENASMVEVKRSARIAQALDFIKNLPDKFASFVAQAGTNFSKGQKQRISIARALVKKAQIYIFDDAFSALDFKTDANLRQDLKEEIKDAAFIIVAQRVSTIRNADQIIVINDGKIDGIGKHSDLLVSSSVYRQIVESQEREGQ